MNNLTQTQQDAKQAYLNYQSEQMLALYKKQTQTKETQLSSK
jgi:hypothetical protein